MQSFGHEGSRINLLGEDATLEQIQAFSAEQQVKADALEAFIWHTSDDQAVPVENSLRYALALGAHGIPYDLHVFEKVHMDLGWQRTMLRFECGLICASHGLKSRVVTHSVVTMIQRLNIQQRRAMP